MRLQDGRQAQEQMDLYSGVSGWWKRRHDFPRYKPRQGYRQTWQDFVRQAERQIQTGHQTEKELPAARASLDQMRWALQQVQQRVKDIEAAPVLKRMVALDEAQQHLKP